MIIPTDLKSEYPFTSHFHNLNKLNNEKLHYIDEGKGDVMLMLHGNPTWSFFYRNLVKSFARSNRVVVPDHIGCGLSDKPQHYDYTLENHIKNTISLINKLQLKDITLLVHDWGGAIGMGVATRHPELIKQIVIMNTAAFCDTKIPFRINILRNTIGEWFIRTFNGFALPATTMAVTKKLSPLVKKGFILPYDNFESRIATAKFVLDIPMNDKHPTYKTLSAIEARLKTLKVPILILWGEKDFCFTLKFKDRWLDFFPQAKVVTYPDAGHYLLEDKTNEVISEIKNFLKVKSNSCMNIAQRLSDNAKTFPEKKAVMFPHFNVKFKKYDYSFLTFKELDILSNKYANQLEKMGFKAGDKTLFFLRPSLDFSAMTFALFKLGVVPIFIDPGMGRKNLLKCISESSPVALIAEQEVHIFILFYSLFFRSPFKTIKFKVTSGAVAWGRMKTLKEMKKEKKQTFTPKGLKNFADSDTAAILFTSGGTGAPKGVVYTHAIFDKQTQLLKDLYKLTENDIDLPGFPLFSLFTVAMGMTSCIPDMDPGRPGKCDPKKLYQNIRDQNPTFVAGSPAIWERLADYCISEGLLLPSIKYLVMFGAPVSVSIHKKFKTLLPNGTTYTPYGATEALPVSNVSGDFILKNTAHLTDNGFGTCIGFVVPETLVKIIAITDDVIESMNSVTIQAPNVIGEIIVCGPTVTEEYLNLPETTREAKIYETSGNSKITWHRMGDLGFIDNDNKLWFVGRKAHRVATAQGLMTPITCEAIFNKHPAVKRSALVGLGLPGNQQPAIVIERRDGQYLSGKERSLFESELLAMARKNPITETITKVYLSRNFPVDVRHNIKIDRTKLKEEIEAHEPEY